MIHVPYRGVAPAFTDLLAGHIVMVAGSPVELKPYLESGKLKRARGPRHQAVAVPARRAAVTETLKDCPPAVTYNGLLGPKEHSAGGRRHRCRASWSPRGKSQEFMQRVHATWVCSRC